MTYDINADGTFDETTDNQYLIRTPEGVQALTQVGISYSESMQMGQIVEAYTLKRDGRRIIVPKDRIFVRAAPLAAGAPEFDDDKVVVAVLSDAEVGDRVGFRAVVHQKKPLIVGAFSNMLTFPRDVIIDDATIDMTAPARGFPLHVDAEGVANPPPEERGGRLHWRWRFENHAVEPSDDDSTLDEYARGSYLAVSSLPDFKALASRYEEGAADKSEVTPDIAKLAASLTERVSDRHEQARRLYEWVANNIRYVAVAIGTGAIVPHDAAEVLARRYGDCKDHVVLLEALLAAKGIRSTGALIVTGRHYNLASVAALQFDHIITYIPEFDLYADSTARYTPFGVLPFVDVGKPVLLTGSGEVRRTPSVDAARNAVRVTTRVVAKEDGSADADSEITASGIYTIARRAQMAEITRLDQEAAYLRQEYGSNVDGTLDKGHWQELSDHFSVKAHYSATNYLSLPGPGALSLTELLTADSVNGLVQTRLASRHYAYECPSGTFSEQTQVVLPKNRKILAIPKSAHWQIDGLTFDLSYRKIDARTVEGERTLVIDEPARACTADYYNKILRPALLKIRGALRAMVLYE